MTVSNGEEVLPSPVFEGSEKRVEISFCLSSDPAGLRRLTRTQLDELMTLAACTIVSATPAATFDSYVLSESSLFVYPSKWVLKTCGTTKLLNSVPRLLEMAAELGLTVRRCKFTRASYLFPERQLFPHTGFQHEVEYLDSLFVDSNLSSESYLMGEDVDGLMWHVYVAEACAQLPLQKPNFNLEVCMTNLHPEKAAQFFRTSKFVSAADTTEATGICHLLPHAKIDDYVFDPCGYSMNGVEDNGFMTIHITPEAGFSYASVELCGFHVDKFQPSRMLSQIARIFEPGNMSISVSVDVTSPTALAWGSALELPDGFICMSGSCQDLLAGGRVVYYTLAREDTLKAPSSPVAVLRHMPSFLTSSSDSDTDVIELMD